MRGKLLYMVPEQGAFVPLVEGKPFPCYVVIGPVLCLSVKIPELIKGRIGLDQISFGITVFLFQHKDIGAF